MVALRRNFVTHNSFGFHSYFTSNGLDASVEIDPAPDINTMTRPCRCDIDFRFMKADELGLFFRPSCSPTRIAALRIRVVTLHPNQTRISVCLLLMVALCRNDSGSAVGSSWRTVPTYPWKFRVWALFEAWEACWRDCGVIFRHVSRRRFLGRVSDHVRGLFRELPTAGQEPLRVLASVSGSRRPLSREALPL